MHSATYTSIDVDIDTYIDIVKRYNLSSTIMKFTSNNVKYKIWTEIHLPLIIIEINTEASIMPAIPLERYTEKRWNEEKREYV